MRTRSASACTSAARVNQVANCCGSMRARTQRWSARHASAKAEGGNAGAALAGEEGIDVEGIDAALAGFALASRAAESSGCRMIEPERGAAPPSIVVAGAVPSAKVDDGDELRSSGSARNSLRDGGRELITGMGSISCIAAGTGSRRWREGGKGSGGEGRDARKTK